MVVANDPTVKGYLVAYIVGHTTQSLLGSIYGLNKLLNKMAYPAFTWSTLEVLTCLDRAMFFLLKLTSVEYSTTWLACHHRAFLRFQWC